MSNPFEILETRLSSVESLLLDIKHKETALPETLLSKQEVVEFLGITMNTLSKHTKAGIIPAYGIGSRVMYKRSEVLQSLIRINK
ncbi:helix-turn-helix domain-containing protein [Flavobacterium yafengii]|uniref:helix-turn-helix domain-containing protein n=1 Tax=Flavobacterium yafengii TaxID=3041253 RepID=UPI0024A8D302|nr:helix-turn-helix domain-containing protein [Flavobacterium yafengii]MDI5897018.1 helix-turn-helix domain-containing protein [Flavobacterium yafengii]